jgi:hypothetical protein
MTNTTLNQAHTQWADRPDDERFTSLTTMAEVLADLRRHSKAVVLPTRALHAEPVREDDARGLVVIGPDGSPADVSHYAFGQLAQRAGAPAGYLRTLPAPLVADCVNVGLAQRPVEELGILLRNRVGGSADIPTLAAATGPQYGRVWNADVVTAMCQRFGDGVTGHFRVPGIRGTALAEVTKENTTLYAGDRDMFLFLADEERRIEVPNRRDGEPGSLARGFFVWNSEVGSATFGVATFLFDFVCQNRIVWGADEYREIRIRHTSGAPDRWIGEVAPALERYAASSDASVVKALESARNTRIGDGTPDAVRKVLETRFTKSQTGAILTAHALEEHRPIETLWDAAVGVSAYARGVPYQNDRVELERAAGALMAGR